LVHLAPTGRSGPPFIRELTGSANVEETLLLSLLLPRSHGIGKQLILLITY